MNKLEVIKFNQKNVYAGISKKGYGKTYFASKDFRAGERIMCGHGKIINHQTPHISVQIAENKHYLPEKWTGRYWNHSCNPNTYAKTRKDGFPDLIALKKIRKNEEICFPYWTTEYEWSKEADECHMPCKCGQKKCFRKIFSFSQLPKKYRAKLTDKKLCSKYLINVNKKI